MQSLVVQACTQHTWAWWPMTSVLMAHAACVRLEDGLDYPRSKVEDSQLCAINWLLLKPPARRIPTGAGIPCPLFQSRTKSRSHGQLRRIALRLRLSRAGRNCCGKNRPARPLATRKFPTVALPPKLPTKHAAPSCLRGFLALATLRRTLLHQFFLCLAAVLVDSSA